MPLCRKVWPDEPEGKVPVIVCQVAKPEESEVKTLPEPGEPPVILI